MTFLGWEKPGSYYQRLARPGMSIIHLTICLVIVGNIKITSPNVFAFQEKMFEMVSYSAKINIWK